MGKNIKYKGLEITLGNTKLGTDTMILNMGSATNCPSAKLGLCKLGKRCYALKAEKLYPQCKPYRDRQEAYWINNTPDQIWADLEHLLTTKKRRINGKLAPLHTSIHWFRFNESGDFHNQECIEKLNFIAFKLKANFNIQAYGYSARSDLDFSKAKSINVKGSGHDNGNNGRTMAMKMTKKQKEMTHFYHQKDGRRYDVCPMDCKKCDKCKTNDHLNIVFPLH